MNKEQLIHMFVTGGGDLRSDPDEVSFAEVEDAFSGKPLSRGVVVDGYVAMAVEFPLVERCKKGYVVVDFNSETALQALTSKCSVLSSYGAAWLKKYEGQ